MKKSTKKINFNSGPGALPEEVLQQAAQAVIEYENSGLSILGIPHRGKHFDAILQESKALVKELCGLNADYEVLWMHGGGRLQFAMVPMNYLGSNETAGYIDSGSWSAEAIEYAKHYGQVNILASSKAANYSRLPQWPVQIPADLAYLHLTTNNTIYGTQLQQLPVSNVPLIADMSSDIFCCSRKYDNCAMFYAVAQKNIGPAGATLAVIHKDFAVTQKREVPPMLSYAAHIKKNSVLNTPPVFAIYTSLLMLRWTKNKGIGTIEAENKQKAAILYEEVERNSLFHSHIYEPDKSIMNACFGMKEKALEEIFIDYCEENGVTGIGGHRTVGGLRVSIYNATSKEDVRYFVGLMKEFEDKHTS
jgi:phosphoserine aminotransferase